MPKAIHQIVAGYSNGDAISNEARHLRDLFRSWGYESEIYCEAKRILPELRADSRDVQAARETIRPDDIVLLHLSIGSMVNEVFASLPCRRALLYHNVTPAEYFRGWQEEIVGSLRKGREQVQRLAGAAEVNMAVSRYNAAELEQAGYKDVRVLPLLLDRKLWDVPPSQRVLKSYAREDRIRVLFVGRCAPNKRIEDLLGCFYYLQKFVEPESRLVHVGSFSGLERYYGLLRAKVAELRLQNVVFAGSVRQEELNAYFKLADVFLCMSEHEGFCIPLLEAMHHGVPVLAYAAGAVPETLDGSGVLFTEKKFDAVAEMIARLARDKALRDPIIKRQHERVEAYMKQDLAAELKEALKPLMNTNLH
ncbi:MAG TPA: glycosyltransferase family 4 protein [Kiritimatiellia bacterium]|jgi:glycosyltransferase involved in cell wall biosynthesis